MEASNIEVLRQAHTWLAADTPVFLATVVRTWGSSPRPPGSLAAIAGGQIVGSVSGGCVEADLQDFLANEGHDLDAPRRLRYGLTAEEARRFGLPCGGTLEVVIERLHQSDELAQVLTAVEAGELIARRLDTQTGASELMAGDANRAEFSDDGQMVTLRLGPAWRLLLIGAGQTSRYVAEMGRALGYAVTVCDPRIEYVGPWDVPEVAVTQAMPDDAVRAMMPDRHTAVVTLTHDPKLDDLALWEALTSEAFYVGALGSQRTNDARRERLRSLGVPAHLVAELHGPVGLPIGSRTPPEIAVSVLAELTAYRHGGAAIASNPAANAIDRPQKGVGS